MKYINNRKGQNLVEFVLLLAFVAAIGLSARETGLLEATATLFEPAKEILYKIDHNRDYDLTAAVNFIEENQSYYHENGDKPGANDRNFRRGMVRSGWVDEQPPQDAEGHNKDLTLMNQLRDELGAAQWSYLNGVQKTSTGQSINSGNYIDDFKGFYWTVMELKMEDFELNSTNQKENFSKQKVLQYFYHYNEATNEGRYYVVKSQVWLSQEDVVNKVALGALGKQYSKPAGVYVKLNPDGTTSDVQVGTNLDETMGFRTLKEAKEVFEAARAENAGKLIFES